MGRSSGILGYSRIVCRQLERLASQRASLASYLRGQVGMRSENVADTANPSAGLARGEQGRQQERRRLTATRFFRAVRRG